MGRSLTPALHGGKPGANLSVNESAQWERGDSSVKELFDRWAQVWHEGQYALVPECVGPHYIRHDEAGDRTVTREAYAAEIAKIREERPDIRVVVYDHSFTGARVWFRFAFKWTDPKTGEPRSRAGGINAAVVGLLGEALYNPLWICSVKSYADFAIALTGFILLVAWRAPPLLVVILGALAGVAFV
jgi:hypothetical protein